MNSCKSSFYMYISVIFITIINIILSGANIAEGGFGVVMIIGFMLLMATTVYFILGNSLKSNNYSLIAGYDRRIEYNIAVLRQIIQAIIFFTMLECLLYSSLITACRFIDMPGKNLVTGIITILFIIDFVGVIIFINYKRMDELYIDISYVKVAKPSLIVVCLFIILIFAYTGEVIFLMEFFNIQNNTNEAMLLALYVIPYLIFSVTMMAYEQYYIKKVYKDNIKYRPSKCLYICLCGCIMLLLMVIYSVAVIL